MKNAAKIAVMCKREHLHRDDINLSLVLLLKLLNDWSLVIPRLQSADHGTRVDEIFF